MEQALINLLNLSDLSKKFKIELLVGYATDPSFQNLLPQSVKTTIISKNWNLFGKIKAVFYYGIKITKAKLFPNQYDYSISYSYQHASISLLTRLESENNAIFIHTDLINSRSKQALKKLTKKIKFEKFKTIICISECAKQSFNTLFPNLSKNTHVINNFIDFDKIDRLSSEPINFDSKKQITFLNVSRHDNDDNKKITRILRSSKKLLSEGYDFKVLLIGGGKEDKNYEKYIKSNKLNNAIYLLGEKANPYPYFLISDALILSSKYEGYGIVMDEARYLNLPIISTKVGDAERILSEGYGILCENSTDGIYIGMKEYLENGYSIKKSFDKNKFNKEINSKIMEVFK